MILMSEEQKKNLAVADQINREARANPDSPYAGKYVGVFHEKVVAVADTAEELDAQLSAMGDVDNEAIWIEASVDYEQTYYIWRL